MENCNFYLEYESRKKSAGLGFVLTLFLGPIGLFYSNSKAAWIVSILTYGPVIYNLLNVDLYSLFYIGLSLGLLVWVSLMFFISIILSLTCISNYNKELARELIEGKKEKFSYIDKKQETAISKEISSGANILYLLVWAFIIIFAGLSIAKMLL